MAGQPLFTNLFVPLPPFLQLPEQKAFREEVERSGASPALVEKMLQGTPLTLTEIEELSQKQINPTNIVKYLRTSGALYTLTTKDVNALQQANVDSAVIDYLLSTPAVYRERANYYRYYPVPWYSSYWWWHHDFHHYDSFHHHDFHHGGHHGGHH